MNIYEFRRYGTFAFLLASVIVVGIFLYGSSSIVGDISRQEVSLIHL